MNHIVNDMFESYEQFYDLSMKIYFDNIFSNISMPVIIHE